MFSKSKLVQLMATFRKNGFLVFVTTAVLALVVTSITVGTTQVSVKNPSNAGMLTASDEHYHPSVGDHFTFNYSKRFSALTTQTFAVYNASDRQLLYMVNITVHSEGLVRGVVLAEVISVSTANHSNQFNNATVSYQINGTIELSYSFEQVLYVPLPPPLAPLNISKISYSSPSKSVPWVDDGTSVLLYNDTYFFLGGSENGTITIGAPFYALNELGKFIDQFVDENDTSLPINASSYVVPLSWTVTHGQEEYNINGQQWILNTTTFSTMVSYEINETHPVTIILENKLMAWFLQANVTNFNVTFSLGTLAFMAGVSATYDNVTGHILQYQNNVTSEWQDLMINGTAEYNGSTILFNATENSRATCQAEAGLIYHSVLYHPTSSTTTSTSTSPISTTTSTTSTSTSARDTSTSTTTTTTNEYSSSQPSTSTSTSADNKTLTSSESNITTPSLVTSGFGMTITGIAILFSLATIALTRKKR